MKIDKLFLLITSILWFSFLNASKASEKYTVVKVIGKIVVKKTGALLSQGDIILSTEPIIFKTPESKASVVSNERGRFILSANNKENSSSSVKSSLLPPMSNISTRGGPILSLGDLKNNFDGNYLILKQAEFPIAKFFFPMNDSSFFYFIYNYKGQDINKKLTSRLDTLLIIEDELFKVDGKSITHAESTFVKLNYYSNKKSLFINEFKIITPSNDQITKEVKMILDGLKNKPYKEIVNDVTSYFNEFYGKTDQDNVRPWLKENFNLPN